MSIRRRERVKRSQHLRQWEVKKDYQWLWPIVFSIIGLGLMTAIMMFLGTR